MKSFICGILPALVFLSSCSSTKKTQGETVVQKTNVCNQSIRYIIEKAQSIKDGNETRLHAEFTIDPTAKVISLHADDPEKGKVSFETEIENIECNLNENLTTGQAIYKGYIKQDDGSKTWTSLLVETKSGQILIRIADQNNPGAILFVVDRWVVTEH